MDHPELSFETRPEVSVTVKSHSSTCYVRTDPTGKHKRSECECPKYYYISPGRLRFPIGTGSWDLAEKRAKIWADDHDPDMESKRKRTLVPKTPQEACQEFVLIKAPGLKKPTLGKINTLLGSDRKKGGDGQLLTFLAKYNAEQPAAKQIKFVHQITVPILDQFQLFLDEQMPDDADEERMSIKSKKKKQGYLAELFDFCLQRNYIPNTGETMVKRGVIVSKDNPARFMKISGRNSGSEEVMPLSDRLYQAFLDAADRYDSSFKRRPRQGENMGARIRLAMELGRNAGFSISDVALSETKNLTADNFFDVDRQKTGKPALVKQKAEFADRLRNIPRGHDTHPAFFFWNGKGERDNACDKWQTAFQRVRSMIDPQLIREEMGTDKKGRTIMPTFHCFRYSFAEDLFNAGADVPEVAKLMGDTDAVVRQHYYKFSKKMQEKANRLMDRVHDNASETLMVLRQTEAVGQMAHA